VCRSGWRGCVCWRGMPSPPSSSPPPRRARTRRGCGTRAARAHRARTRLSLYLYLSIYLSIYIRAHRARTRRRTTPYETPPCAPAARAYMARACNGADGACARRREERPGHVAPCRAVLSSCGLVVVRSCRRAVSSSCGLVVEWSCPRAVLSSSGLVVVRSCCRAVLSSCALAGATARETAQVRLRPLGLQIAGYVTCLTTGPEYVIA
jgi:hypothetical protein